MSDLTISELAEALQVSERQVRRWIDLEKVRAYRLGRLVRIRREELERVRTEGVQ